MNGAIFLIVGLTAGAAIGYLFAALQRKTDPKSEALIEDYKKQLDSERNKTENSIKLTAELNAMKETVKELSQQSNEANRTRT